MAVDGVRLWAGLAAAASTGAWILLREGGSLGAAVLADGLRTLWLAQALLLLLPSGPRPGSGGFVSDLAGRATVLLAGLPVAVLPWAAGSLPTPAFLAGLGALTLWAVALAAAEGWLGSPGRPSLRSDLWNTGRVLLGIGAWAGRDRWLFWLGI